jgi:hypothetical protein
MSNDWNNVATKDDLRKFKSDVIKWLLLCYSCAMILILTTFFLLKP